MDEMQSATAPEVGERLMELHLQEFVANNLQSVLPNVSASLLGREVQTEAGRIDVLAQDSGGRHWGIETKVGVAGRDAVGQLQSYLAASRELESFKGVDPIGVLIAEDFDKPCLYALQQTDRIRTLRYTVTFRFASDAGAGSTQGGSPSDPARPWIVDLDRRVVYPKGYSQNTAPLADRAQVAERLRDHEIEIHVGSRRLGRYRRVPD